MANGKKNKIKVEQAEGFHLLLRSIDSVQSWVSSSDIKSSYQIIVHMYQYQVTTYFIPSHCIKSIFSSG